MHWWRVSVLALLALATVSAQFQPLGSDFSDLVERDELGDAGATVGAERVLRFVQVSDAHVLDDDAPYPMRQEVLDPYITPVSASAQRPQDEYTDEVLNRAIAAINAIHEEDALDFVINTGDNIDNQLENELMRFIDNWEGTLTTVGPISGLQCVPDGQSADVNDDSADETEDCTHMPASVAMQNVPLAAGLPWFSAFGNHDGLIQGNVPIEPSFQELAETYGRFFLEQTDYVAMHFRAGTQCLQGEQMGDVYDDFGHGYGFARSRLCDEDPDNDGYYSFDLAGVHVVVLDTLNDDFFAANEHLQGIITPQGAAGFDLAGGYEKGAIDPAQFAWLEAELNNNQDRLVLLMSHHTINTMFSEETDPVCCGPSGESLEDLLSASGFKTRKDMAALLANSPQVVAWIGGHAHANVIQAKNVGAGESPGFWNIETSSLIDSPQEARVIEIWSTDDGSKGFLAMRSFTHDFEKSRTLADADPQAEEGAAGTDVDQDVLLWFDMPPGAKLSPQPRLPQYLIMDLVAPARNNGTDGLVNEPLTVTVNITDSVLGAPVPGMEVDIQIRHADPENFKVLIDDVNTNVTSQNGQYSVTFTPPHGATYFMGAFASDPDGMYEPTDLSASFVVEDPDAEPIGKDKKKAPGLPLVAVLGAFLIALRRR